MEDLGAGLPLAMMDGPITAMEMQAVVDIPPEPEPVTGTEFGEVADVPQPVGIRERLTEQAFES